jgi:hypothetical protein
VRMRLCALRRNHAGEEKSSQKDETM